MEALLHPKSVAQWNYLPILELIKQEPVNLRELYTVDEGSYVSYLEASCAST
jgi:hypothetical protein